MSGPAENSKEFKPLALSDIARDWPSIRYELSSIDAPDGWIQEDVYLALKTQNATLYYALVNGVICGWCVLRALDDFDGRRLHIWLLFDREKKFDLMDCFADEVNQLAKSIGALRITFSSGRKGWEKTSGRHGFQLRESIYSKEVVA